MLHYLLIGFSIGFSMASSCISFCGVIFIPLMASRERSFKEGLIFLFHLSLGRFFGYLLFGFLAGYLGAEIDIRIRLWFTTVSYLFLAPLIILYTTDFLSHKLHKAFFKKTLKSPFLLGFTTGMNFCPAFLALFFIAFESGSLIGSVFLFLSFYFITTIFLFILLLGVPGSKIELLRKIARILSYCVAGYLLIQAASNFTYLLSI